MSKIDLVPITGAQQLSAINDNFRKVEEALNDKVLYRDNPSGEPNQVKSDVDMNGKRIYNLPQPQSPSEPVRYQDLGDVTSLTEEARGYAEAAEASATIATDNAAAAASSSLSAAGHVATAQQAVTDATAQATAAAGSATDSANSAIASANSAAESANKVAKTSDTGSAKMPSGTEAQRDAAPEAGWTRFNTDESKLEVYNGTEWTNIGGAGGSLFDNAWHNGPRSSISAGFVPQDGQVLQFADFPVVCQAIWDGKQNAVLEANWAANKNCWSRGDGATWVRVPNLNMADGSEKPFYLRGGPESLTGTWVGDAMQGHWHQSYTGSASSQASMTQGNQLPRDAAVGIQKTVVNNFANEPISDGVNGIPRIAEETRVKTAYGVWVVRIFTEVTNTGAIDASQLATQLGVVDAALQTLDAQLGFTIIYPNGGNEATPATIAANSRYLSPNPFPGYHVFCEAQILVGGIWASAEWFGSASTAGARASQMCNSAGAPGQVVVQTGTTGVGSRSVYTGSAHGYTGSDIASAQCRVIVRKLEG